MSIYEFKVKGMKGEEISLDKYKNKVILIINSATECGFTPQYDELQELYDKYAESGFVVLDFPCNQFFNQAPGTDDEIKSFCETRYGITFPIFSKIDVKGENAAPLYQYLISSIGFKGFDEGHPLYPVLKNMYEEKHPNYVNEPDIKWNFTKFLIDRNGNVAERFEPTKDMKYIEERIKELLSYEVYL